MASVRVTERMETSADSVWAFFRDFGGVLKYSRGLESCTVEGDGIGAVRTITMPGGASLKERLESFDDAGRTFSYAIIGESPLPVDDYLSTVKVIEDGAACTVDWSSTFEPRGVPEEQVAGILEGVYRGGIRGIQKALGL